MAGAGNQSQKTIVVDFQLMDKDIVKNVQSLQQKIENLKSTLAGMRDAGMQNSETYIKLSAALKEMQSSLKANQTALVESIREQKSEGDSLNAMRAQLSQLLKTYDDLSKAERESAKGTDLLNHIKELTEEVKELENGTKRFGRSVGSYEEALANALSGAIPMKQALRSIKEELTSLEVEYRQSASLIEQQKQLMEEIARTQGVESDAYKQASADLDEIIKKRGEMNAQISDMTQKAGELHDAIDDVNKSIASAGTDNAPLVAAKQSADLLVNSYTALQGTLVALGIEDKNLVEIYAKLQIVQKGLNAVTQVYNLLQKQSVLRQQLSVLWTKLTTVSLGSLIAAKKNDSAASVAATAATGALAAGEAATTATSWTLVGALKAVSAAIMSIPIIGWILAVISALITVISLIFAANKEEEKGNEISDKILESDRERLKTLSDIERKHAQINAEMEKNLKTIQEADKSTRAYKDAVKEVADYLEVSEEYLKAHPEKLQEAIDKQTELNELTEKEAENRKAIDENTKSYEDMLIETQGVLNASYEESERLLDKMVEDNKITEGQRKSIAKLRKQYIKQGLTEFEQEQRIRLIMYDQVKAWEGNISKAEQMNKTLSTQKSLVEGTLDALKSDSDAFDKQKENAKKYAEAAKERRRTELNERRKTEDMELQILKDGLDKQLKTYRVTLDRQIEDLKNRLKEEKNLSKKAREEINKQIAMLTARQSDEEWKIRRKYNEDNLKKELDFWKRYYKAMEDANPVETDKGLEARLKSLDIAFEASVDALKKSMQPINDEYLEWERMSLTVGKEREDMLKRLGLTEEEFGNAFADIVNKWDDANKAYGESLDNLEKEHKNATIRMEKQSEESLRKLRDERNQLISDNFYNEALGEIEVGNFADKEVRKTEILKDQAFQRLQIAQQEVDRLQSMSEEEQIAIYGTQESYDLALQKGINAVTDAQIDYKKAAKANTDALKAQKDAALANGMAIAEAFAQMSDSISNLFNTLAEDNEEYQDFATGMAMAQILISTAVSIAQAIQAAVQAGGFTGVAAPITIPVFIAELVGIVAAGISSAVATLNQAKQARSSAPKFAEGGLVGTRTTRRKDDTVSAKLTLGEYVIPAEVVDDLGVDFFDRIIGRNGVSSVTVPRVHFADGGLVGTLSSPSFANVETFDYDRMKDVMVEAVSEVKPVVSVKEITSAQHRVEVKERVARS